MSKAHDQTDEILAQLERRIKRLYAKETEEVREKVAAYSRNLKHRKRNREPS